MRFFGVAVGFDVRKIESALCRRLIKAQALEQPKSVKPFATKVRAVLVEPTIAAR